MQTDKPSLPFLTLILMISFASVNAVLFTPALPDMATFFRISDDVAQYTVSWFLIGYAVGQLLYGPLADRFGRKPALYIGIALQIVASLCCVLAGLIESFSFLIVSRFLVALGSGVGLKMTFTLVNECYEPKQASQKISYLMLAFAITPGLGVALGGVLNAHFGWISCFVAGAIYGVILLAFVACLPKFETTKNLKALEWSHLTKAYFTQLSNKQLISGGLLMGASTCFVYVFAALAPFIAINILHMSSQEYGTANILPSIGLVLGSLSSAYLVKKFPLNTLIKLGILVCTIGTLLMMSSVGLSFPPLVAIFVPMIIVYFGLSFILANASSIAMSQVNDKAHGSAMMSFINMGLATVVVLSLGWFSTKAMLLPMIYLILCFAMLLFYRWLIK